MSDLLLSDIFDIQADLLVIPVSSDGSLSESMERGLYQHGIKYRRTLKLKLGDIKIVPVAESNKFKYVAYVCSVKDFSSTYSAIRNIGRELAAHRGEIKSLVSPIIGSGAGALNSIHCLNIMRTAFYEIAPNDITLTFCTRELAVKEQFDYHLLEDGYTSAQMVISAEMEKILKLHQINELIHYKDFYFDIARDKYFQYKEYDNEKPFFRYLLDRFKDFRGSYQNFLKSLAADSAEYRFVRLCGELIAYIDYTAYQKNNWNEYPDKRVLARSGVNQSLWLRNLIRIKLLGNIQSIQAQSIKNALLYLENPDTQLTMLSEDHRKKVFSKMLLTNYEGPGSLYKLNEFFVELGFHSINPANQSALNSRLLYAPEIKRLWDGEQAGELDSVLKDPLPNSDLLIARIIINDCLESGAKSLDLGRCGLTDLSEIDELFDCRQLEELILSNEWAEFEAGQWHPRESNNRGEPNFLQNLPTELGTLKNLKRLVCGGDWRPIEGAWKRWEISDISVIGKLTALKYLNLSNNAISNLSPVKTLEELQILHLNNNKIVKLDTIAQLFSLREIYLSNNRINSVEALRTCSWLRTIDLHSNQIKDISPLESLIESIGIKNKSWETNTINIAKNPLSFPPMKIVNIGSGAVLSNIRDVLSGGSFINTDVKIIFIGNSETGKSTLVRYLAAEKDLSKKKHSTLWMEERIVNSKYKVDRIGKHCRLHLFDFGGHDFYHDTHHMFFSTNTIYLLLWNQEHEHLKTRQLNQTNEQGGYINVLTQDYPVKYWLDAVKFYTKQKDAENFAFKTVKPDAYLSQLMLIQNKVKSTSEIKFLNNAQLKMDYGFVSDILDLSLFNPARHLQHFDETLLEMLNSMEIVGERLPSYYGQIKTEIERYASIPVLTQQEFLHYCNTITDNTLTLDQAKYLLGYLEQIGLVICTNRTLSERIYMNKKWIVSSMHKLLDRLTEKRGELTLEEALKRLDGDKKHLNDILLLMLEYKVIFQHPFKDKTFVAPLYLPEIPSGTILMFVGDWVKPFRRFEYTGFIHKHVILSFFEKYSASIKKPETQGSYYYWKDALIIKDPVSHEIVMIRFYLGDDQGNARIDLFTLQNKSEPVFILEVIEFVRQVNQGYELEEMVTLNGDDFVSLDVLEKNAADGKWVFTERRLSELAQQTTDQPKILKLKDYHMFTGPVKKKKVVISYSKKDLAQVHILKRYLDPLVADGLIDEPWYCTSLLPGDDWNTKIGGKFAEADIIFFMISDYFYTTKYIVEHEIKNAIDRYLKGDPIKIVPVILEYYDWGREGIYNLKNFTALPYQAKPLSDYDNPKIAWSTITTSVRNMIEKDLDPYKDDIVTRDVQELLERQVSGKLDRNS